LDRDADYRINSFAFIITKAQAAKQPNTTTQKTQFKLEYLDNHYHCPDPLKVFLFFQNRSRYERSISSPRLPNCNHMPSEAFAVTCYLLPCYHHSSCFHCLASHRLFNIQCCNFPSISISERMAHYPPGSPPRQNAVTPSSSQRGRQEMHGHVRNPGGHPYVYQVYGRPESGGFGNFSPVRTRPYSNVSPPSTRSDSVEDSLYASFSPPRRGGALPPPRQHRGAAAGNASIFRPKQGIVIVARNSSSHDDNSSVTCGTKNNNFASPATSTPAPYTRQANEPSIVKPNTAFPCKLHEILSSPKYQDLIAWLPHGRAWRVLKPKVFEEKIIPKFFRSSKYASFMRQVGFVSFAYARIQNPFCLCIRTSL